MTDVLALDALVALIPDGAMLLVPADYTGVAIAATRARVARGVRGLHLLCLPSSGIQADLLVAAGCVRTLKPPPSPWANSARRRPSTPR
jgi:glutaconate CoA-transferase subunit A